MSNKDNNKAYIRIVCFAISVLFVISLIPVLYVSRYDFASGDDYAFGAAAHLAFRQTGNVIDAVIADAGHTAYIYNTWQGTWMSVFAFGLHPEVFSDRAYVIVPWLMIGVTLFAVWYASGYFLHKIFDINITCTVSITLLIASAIIHFVPTKSNAFYWYNGAMHYTVPFALMLLAITDGTKFICDKKTGALIRTTIWFTILGGMSYLAALAAPVGVFFIYLFYRITLRNRFEKKECLLLIPVFLEAAGLIISALAPGNKVRGGEEFGFSVAKMAGTIAMCFVQSFRHAVSFITSQPFVIIIAAAMIVCVFASSAGGDKKFKASPLILIMAFVWNACVYAPEIYSGVEVSEGVNNTYFMVFMISLSVVVIYYSKCFQTNVKVNVAVSLGAWAVILLLAIVCRHSLADSTFKVCTDFIRKGYGEDLRAQMILQQELLNTDDEVVTIPSTNGYGGPIMNMPAEESPDAWTNGALARFYGKKTVYGMDADEWHALYDER